MKAKPKSRSPSPVDTAPVKEKIEFITAFGNDDANGAGNDAKRKRPFEKSLLDECREAKKKAEPAVIPTRTGRLVSPPRLPAPRSVDVLRFLSSILVDFSTSFVPCRSVQRKSQVLLSALQKLKEDSSPFVSHCLLDSS